MDVTKENFMEALPKLKNCLQECAFYSVDLEMTGIVLPYNKINSIENLSQRYLKLKKVSETFLPTQFGISTFKKVGEDRVVANKFNFYIFPDTRNNTTNSLFSADANTFTFLARHNFDFNTWIKKGVPFYRISDFNGVSKRRDAEIEVTEENLEFMTYVKKELHEFMSNEEPEVLIKTTTPFQRKMGYQQAKSICGNSAYVKAYQNDLKVIRFIGTVPVTKTPAELNFFEVISLLLDCKKPLVAHNCYCDLLFIVHHFINDLPSSLDEYKKMIHELFPTIIDTKHVFSAHPAFKNFKDASHLKSVYQLFSTKPFDATNYKIEEVDAMPSDGFVTVGRNSEAKEHNAGYDALITGKIFCNMLAYLNQLNLEDGEMVTFVDLSFTELEGTINKIFNMLSEFHYVDLLAPESAPQPKHDRFLISNITSGTKTSELFRLFCTDTFQTTTVHWINSTSAWVDLDLKLNPEQISVEERLLVLSAIPTATLNQLWQQNHLDQPNLTKETLKGYGDFHLTTWTDWYRTYHASTNGLDFSGKASFLSKVFDLADESEDVHPPPTKKRALA